MRLRAKGQSNRSLHRGREGFALIEVIVAFVILALGIGTISVGVATAMRSDAKASNMRAMTRIAQSRLEAAGIAGALVIGQREGRTGQFVWRETVTRARISAGTGRRDDNRSQPDTPVPLWVEIAIRAADGTEEKLAALKLVTHPVPQ